jgi:hypothetical protein
MITRSARKVPMSEKKLWSAGEFAREDQAAQTSQSLFQSDLNAIVPDYRPKARMWTEESL